MSERVRERESEREERQDVCWSGKKEGCMRNEHKGQKVGGEKDKRGFISRPRIARENEV